VRLFTWFTDLRDTNRHLDRIASCLERAIPAPKPDDPASPDAEIVTYVDEVAMANREAAEQLNVIERYEQMLAEQEAEAEGGAVKNDGE
jgi:hypothetical protein